MLSLPLAFLIVQTQSSWSQNWSTIRSSIEGQYYARVSQHKKMEELLDRYEPRAKAAKSESEFERVVNEMIDAFTDSHFDLYTKADQGYYMMDSLVHANTGELMPHIGAWFEPVKGGQRVQMLIEQGPADKAGIRKGDILLTVNGLPVQPVKSFEKHKGEKVTVTYQRGSDTKSASVEVEEENGIDFFLDGTRASERVIQSNGKKYGYIHLWTMSNEAQKSALASCVYGKFADTDGMILDIRDGFGGRPEGFGDPFFRPEVHLDWETPGFTNHQLFGYGKPLVVLINKGSRSAKEVFAYIMKKSGRAKIVGQQTGGNVLGTRPQQLDKWGYLEIPAVDVKADGFRIEKTGVAPNVAVKSEYDDKGDDLFIKAAIEELNKSAATRH